MTESGSNTLLQAVTAATGASVANSDKSAGSLSLNHAISYC